MNKTLLSYKKYFAFLTVWILIIFSQMIFPQAPGFQWLKSIGGVSYDAGRKVAVDLQGNIIVTGFFDSTMTIGNYTLNSKGSEDIFIAKYDAGGNPIWAVQAGGVDYDEGYGLTTDKSGNIYVSGSFNQTAIFGSYSLKSSGYADAFVAKYNSNGSLIWVNQAGGPNFDNANSVAVDNSGNVVITGSFSVSIYFGNNITLSGNSYSDIFIAKYDSLGNVLWAKGAGNEGFYNAGTGVSIYGGDSIAVTGTFGGTVNFGRNILTSLGAEDVFIVSYDTNGNVVWARQAGGTNQYTTANDIVVDRNNYIFITGQLGGQTFFGNISVSSTAQSDIYIAKYDNGGNPQWVIHDNPSDNNSGQGIGIDSASNISVIGNARPNSSDFGNIYIGRFSQNGNKLWSLVASGSSGMQAGGITTEINGDLVVTGSYYNSADFGGQNLVSNGSQDIFLGKLPVPQLQLSDSLLDFKTVKIGTSVVKTVLLSNPGLATLHISRISLQDSMQEFAIDSNYADSIQAQQSLALNVSFAPNTPGADSADFIIESDAPDGPHTLILKGNSLAPKLYFSSDTLDFGKVSIYDSLNLKIIAYNLDHVDIIINNMSIAGPDKSEFSIAYTALPDTVPALSSQYLSVNFLPLSAGSKKAFLILSGTNGITDTVTLLGTGGTEIFVQSPDSSIVGRDISLRITPPAGFNFTSSRIYYKRTGELNYQHSNLIPGQNYYTGTIPASYTTIRGVQYYIEFSNGESSITYPSYDPVNSPEYVELIIQNIVYPETVPKSEYRMFSIPLYVFDAYFGTLFTSDYGKYDNSVWRMFRWDPTNESYSEFPDIYNQLFPGNAFWLIEKDGKPFSMKTAYTVPSIEYFPILLTPGWNQIADPFAFPVDWDSVENFDKVQAPIHWNPETQDYELNQTVLQPWDGYWVYCPADTGTAYLFVKNIQSSSQPKKIKNIWSNLKKGEFIIQLKANILSSSVVDNQNFIGMIENAGRGMNKYDILKPPPVTGNLNLNIISDGKRYAQYLVGVSQDGFFWDIEINSNQKGKELSLNVEKKSSLPADFNIWLIDKTNKTVIPVNNDEAVFNIPDNGKGEYRIIIGKEDYAKQHSEDISLVPMEYALYQNYPNPFNPSTTIGYQLKSVSNVTMDVYDILGQKVKVLVNNETQNPGQYVISWDGTNFSGNKVATGIYIYRIIANNFVASKKMILLK